MTNHSPAILRAIPAAYALQHRALPFASISTNNARLVNGQIVYEGETVVVGDTDKSISEPLFGDEVRYELLCRNHYRRGQLGD